MKPGSNRCRASVDAITSASFKYRDVKMAEKVGACSFMNKIQETHQSFTAPNVQCSRLLSSFYRFQQHVLWVQSIKSITITSDEGWISRHEFLNCDLSVITNEQLFCHCSEKINLTSSVLFLGKKIKEKQHILECTGLMLMRDSPLFSINDVIRYQYIWKPITQFIYELIVKYHFSQFKPWTTYEVTDETVIFRKRERDLEMMMQIEICDRFMQNHFIIWSVHGRKLSPHTRKSSQSPRQGDVCQQLVTCANKTRSLVIDVHQPTIANSLYGVGNYVFVCSKIITEGVILSFSQTRWNVLRPSA